MFKIFLPQEIFHPVKVIVGSTPQKEPGVFHRKVYVAVWSGTECQVSHCVTLRPIECWSRLLTLDDGAILFVNVLDYQKTPGSNFVTVIRGKNTIKTSRILITNFLVMGTNPASSQLCVPKLPGEYTLYILFALIYRCPRRNVKYYTDITQNTYIQSWTVTEIMAREKCGHLAFPHTVRLQL